MFYGPQAVCHLVENVPWPVEYVLWIVGSADDSKAIHFISPRDESSLMLITACADKRTFGVRLSHSITPQGNVALVSLLGRLIVKGKQLTAYQTTTYFHGFVARQNYAI